MMKKGLFLLISLMLSVSVTQAQLGGALQKAAKKAVQKTTDKVIDKTTDAAADAAAKAVDKELDKYRSNKPAGSQEQTAPDAAEQQSVASLMAQLPELPTVQQLVNYKTAELNEQTVKLLASPVTSYNAKLFNLSMQVLSVGTQGMDSAQMMETAYNVAEKSTGLSREEIDKLSTMSEEEQEAYLKAHYKSGTYEAAVLQQAAEAGEYLKPVQPLIDQWSAVEEKVTALYNASESSCRNIYAKYADQLSKATGKERNTLLVRYYTEIVPIQREAVQQAMQLRLKEQLPIADKIEEKMVEIRAQHQDVVSMLLNYPQLTATQFFTEPAKLLDIPEYKE
ncbi:MAG: hypothetical protein J6S82_08530 [Bacteroidales bacterium]|nr:hypothetical protein [Bacteroidales bacterium]